MRRGIRGWLVVGDGDGDGDGNGRPEINVTRSSTFDSKATQEGADLSILNTACQKTLLDIKYERHGKLVLRMKTIYSFSS